MVVNELLSLFEIARKLASRKAELDRNYFDEFIQPLWDKFVEIHNNYKTTFQEYTKLATENNDGDISSIIEQIRQDSMYSEDLRNELRSMVNNVPSAFPKTSNQFLDQFLKALSGYFDLRAALKVNREKDEVEMLYTPLYSNAARYRVVVILSRKGSNPNKAEVLKVLQETMQMLQANYKWASNSFYSLKNNLLT
ncbi:MAG TPA: hypothetical protein VN843_04575 [Anaerolineales bacterium]|nr:hypothetical protein [Anaerolineales bacterium]